MSLQSPACGGKTSSHVFSVCRLLKMDFFSSYICSDLLLCHVKQLNICKVFTPVACSHLRVNVQNWKQFKFIILLFSTNSFTYNYINNKK